MTAISCSRTSLAYGFSGWVVTFSTGFSSCPQHRDQAHVEREDSREWVAKNETGELTGFGRAIGPVGTLSSHNERVGVLSSTGTQSHRHERNCCEITAATVIGGAERNELWVRRSHTPWPPVIKCWARLSQPLTMHFFLPIHPAKNRRRSGKCDVRYLLRRYLQYVWFQVISINGTYNRKRSSGIPLLFSGSESPTTSELHKEQ